MKKNELKIGALLSYVSLFLGNIISLLYTPIMLRLLGQAEYGLFSLSNSIIGYLGILDMGFGNAIIRYTAMYRAKGDKESEYNLNGMFIILYSLVAVAIVISGTLLVTNSDKIFSNALSLEEMKKIKLLMALMVFNLAISLPFSIFSSIVTAYEKFIVQKMLGIVRTIMSPLITLPLLLMGYKSISLTIASTLINIIYICFNLYYCVKILKIKIKFNNMDLSLIKEICGYSFFIFINLIVDKIYWNTDQFILGAISGASAVAIYSVGSNFNSYYMSFSTAISGVFLPRVTKMITNNDSTEELSELFTKIGRIQYMVLSFILCGFILIGKDFISIWAGKGYENSYYIALIVMIPLTIPLIQNLGVSILQAKNILKFRANIQVVFAILNIVLSIPLAKVLGGFGCAIASGISFFIGNAVIMNIYYYKKINLDMLTFWKNICIITVPIIISLMIGGLLNIVIVGISILDLIFKGIIFGIIFIYLQWSMAMNNYEKNLLINPMKKIFIRLKLKGC